MSQLAFVDKKLEKKAKREVTRILRSYGDIEALIKSMSIQMPKMTPNYQASESQRDNQFHSSTEDCVIKNIELEIKIKQKEKLDIIYESINDDKKDIWRLRFIVGYSDEQTMIHIHLDNNRNKYFGEKYELMRMIADSFYLW